jgi:hypothetical protein
MKKLFLAIALVSMFFVTSARADLVDLFMKPQPTAKATAVVEPTTILDIVTKVINVVGPKEGIGYDFKQKEVVNILSSTIATKWNTSVNIDLYNTDGVGLGLSYNLGKVLPVANVPVIQYFQYLYVGASYGVRWHDGSAEYTPIVTVQYKLTF